MPEQHHALPPPSPANMRRFPALAAHRPRSFVRPDPSAPEPLAAAAATSPRAAYTPRQGDSQAAQLDLLTNPNTARLRETERRTTGPLAQERHNLLHRSTFPAELSPMPSPRSARGGGPRSPRARPVFAPCNPGQAREAITLPRDKLVNAACPFDSLHGASPSRLLRSRSASHTPAEGCASAGALLASKREHNAKMIGGPFVPSSGVATARRLIANQGRRPARRRHCPVCSLATACAGDAALQGRGDHRVRAAAHAAALADKSSRVQQNVQERLGRHVNSRFMLRPKLSTLRVGRRGVHDNPGVPAHSARLRCQGAG